MVAQRIQAAGRPVLCIDTCSVLDIMRDPTRENARYQEGQAGMDLLSAAESSALLCVMPEHVAIEFAERDSQIQEEADRNLKRAIAQIERINALTAVFGAPPAKLDLSHLYDHVVRSRAIVARWLSRLEVIATSDQAPAKAFGRVNAAIAPAKRGKDSSKDCLIYETILEIAASIRSEGDTVPIVFLSSNTTEYQPKAAF